jgi:uncharacterized membrane protein
LIYYILIGLTAGTIYLTVGIALVSLWYRAVPRLDINSDQAGFFVILWPIVLVCVVMAMVVSLLGHMAWGFANDPTRQAERFDKEDSH